MFLEAGIFVPLTKEIVRNLSWDKDQGRIVFHANERAYMEVEGKLQKLFTPKKKE